MSSDNSSAKDNYGQFIPQIALNLKNKPSPLESTSKLDLWNSMEFLKERQHIFNFLLKVSKKLQLSSKNLFKSFYLFDQYINIKQNPETNQMKIGVVCLFIMTKFEDGKILSFSLFQNIFNGNLTREEYHQIEGDILKSVGYMVNIETVLDAHSLFET